MNSLTSMLLGLAPVPEVKAKGRVHRAEGSAPENKRHLVGPIHRALRTAERRAEILAMIERDGPASQAEIRQEIPDAAKDTIRLDVAELCAEGKLRAEMCGKTKIYHRVVQPS